ncbi:MULTISPECIES: hypothetical protein [unclassified Caballeronia]|uniref:hypothetical protein n=1 Tax=unclassified Caballeronia TaxID=2646786 RepID=UPI00202813F4|nr:MULTISPECIES: hypothetical protein [unclassified Caballeronia]MDR5794958.1 hypothetical protein [Caballeronia sp. LZ008]
MHDLIQSRGDIVGNHFIFTGATQTRRFCQGYRYGSRQVPAAVQPRMKSTLINRRVGNLRA